MEKYQKLSTGDAPRTELHDKLGLTGAEISINRMPAGTAVPFVHSHKQNEEIYGILGGKGVMTLDGEKVELREGDWLRVAPSVKRLMAAADDCQLTYICIQVKEGSLEQMTAADAVI